MANDAATEAATHFDGTANPTGLTSAEARHRLGEFGPNVVAEETTPRWRTFLAKFWAPVPWLAQVRAKLKSHADGDRQFVKVLGAVLDHGLAAVEAACAEALEAGIASGDVILTVLARRRQPAPPPSITTPDALRLKLEPVADCGRYDSIRKVA